MAGKIRGGRRRGEPPGKPFGTGNDSAENDAFKMPGWIVPAALLALVAFGFARCAPLRPACFSKCENSIAKLARPWLTPRRGVVKPNICASA
ncbi:MAG: hypothetical protein FWE09_06750 [Treponema sp.]|nr:hypothetical protein [Treponema sp.]